MEMAKLEQEIRFSVEDFRWAQLLVADITELLKFDLSPIGLRLYLYMFTKAVNAETVSLRDLCKDLKIHRRSVWLNKIKLEKKGLLVLENEKDFLIWKVIPPSKDKLGNTDITLRPVLGDTDITLRHSEEELGDTGITLRLEDSESPNKDSPIEPITSICISSTDINACISNTECISNTICPENSNKPPKLSKKTVCKVSDLEFSDENFPYDSSLQISVIWYWAFKRHRIHRLDQVFNGALFGQMAKKYSHLLRVIGKDDWGAHKKYVDWYLAQESEFIKDECKYNFEYFSSLNCYNKSLSSPTEYYVSTEEERNQHKGVWIRD